MNTNNNDGLMYKAAAFAIFVVLVVLIVLITISTVRDHANDDYIPSHDTNEPVVTTLNTDTTPPPDLPVDTPSADVTSQTDKAPDTTKAPHTDAPDTTKAPQTEAPDTTKDTTPITPPPTNITDSLADFLAKYPDTVLGVTEDAGQEYVDKLVFLGDSTTYGLRYYKMLKGGRDTLQVWTPKSGTLTLTQVSFATIVYPETNAQITIKEAVTAKKPEYLVITLGVNGVSIMKEDFFKSEYTKMIKTIQAASPDTKIICQSIFPVARTYELLEQINNDKIRAANRWIVEVADECGVKFVDTYSVLADDEGWLPEKYHNGDGMHLNPTSFTLELNNLRTHAWVD